MKIQLAALFLLACAVPALSQQAKGTPAPPLQQISDKESKVARKLVATMTLEQRKAFGGAIRSVTGAGRLTGKQAMERAPQAMRPKERPVWAAYVKKLKPDQLAVLKKLLQNAAASKRGNVGVGSSGG